MSIRTIRRTEITVERERRIEIAPTRGAPAMCDRCASPMFEPAAVAAILEVSTHDLDLGIERGAFHVDRRLIVCLHSAAASMKENR